MQQSEIRTITPQQASDLLRREERDYVLVDVRTAAEFEALHAIEAVNVPLHTISPDTSKSLSGKKVLCICQKGVRGEQAVRSLSLNGLNDVCNVEGGTDAWKKAGLPILQGKSAISLERQVRIAAGSLVVAGIAGGYILNPYFIFVSLFVGCGLVFSGVTDTCGMAMILARCPWNSKG